MGADHGRQVAALASGQDAALYLGDAVIDEANFAHPDWVMAVEWDPSMAVATRTALIEQAIAKNWPLIAFTWPQAATLSESMATTACAMWAPPGASSRMTTRWLRALQQRRPRIRAHRPPPAA